MARPLVKVSATNFRRCRGSCSVPRDRAVDLCRAPARRTVRCRARRARARSGVVEHAGGDRASFVGRDRTAHVCCTSVVRGRGRDRPRHRSSGPSRRAHGLGPVAFPLALVAWFFPIGVTGAVPIAAILAHKGMMPGPALALVLVALAAGATSIDILWVVPLGLFVVIAISAAIDLWLGAAQSLHERGNHVRGLYEYVTAVAVAGWILFELGTARAAPVSPADRAAYARQRIWLTVDTASIYEFNIR